MKKNDNIKEKAIIFIDGNNLYHRMREMKLPSDITALDYCKFSQKLVGDRVWKETRYYTGQVKQESNKDLYAKQRKLSDFLQALENASYHKGSLEEIPIERDNPLLDWIKDLDKRSDIKLPQNIVGELRSIAEKPRYTEKAVDEMISVDMVSMAYCGDYDVAYLVSADSDFIPAIKKVREIGKEVIVASTGKRYALEQASGNPLFPLKRDFFDGMMD